MSVMEIYRQRTTLRVVVTVGVGLLIGIGLLWAHQLPAEPSAATGLMRDLGSLLVVTVCLSIAWELGAKRAFAAELLAQSGLAQRIEQTGLVDLPRKWNEDIPWARLLREATHVDIFVAYGANWRGAYGDEWIRFALRPKTTCRIILPDPDDDAVVSAVASQFKRDAEVVRDRIRDAAAGFHKQFVDAGKDDACEVWYHARPPLFAFFICGDTAVITLYKHNPRKPDIMGLMIRRGGSYFDFLEGEVDNILGGDSRRVDFT